MKKVLLFLLLPIFYGSPLKSQDSLNDTNLVNFEKAKLKNISLNEFVYQNLGMPSSITPFDKDLNIVIGFIIKKNGDVDSIKIINNPEKNFTNEVLRVLEKTIGQWIPTKINGVAVDKYYISSFKYIFSNDYADKKAKALKLVKKGNYNQALDLINEAMMFNEYDGELYQIRSTIYKSLNQIDLEKTNQQKIKWLKKNLLINVMLTVK
jgi:hypothetical protein